MISWHDAGSLQWGRLSGERREEEVRSLLWPCSVLDAYWTPPQREIVGYVSLSSGDSLRTTHKHLEVTCIFKARRPTKHSKEMLRHSSGAIQFFNSVQLLSRVWLFAIPWIAARQASLSITNSRSSLRLTSIESVMPSSHLIFCCPLLLLPPIPPSIRVFSNESTLRMRWPKCWSFSFSIIPSKEIPGLISFRMDWLDLLVVQGTLKSLLQHHSSTASILRCSAFFTVQLSHPYMTTGKNHSLD